MKINCPSCDLEYDLGKEYADAKVECEQCKTKFLMPSLAEYQAHSTRAEAEPVEEAEAPPPKVAKPRQPVTPSKKRYKWVVIIFGVALISISVCLLFVLLSQRENQSVKAETPIVIDEKPINGDKPKPPTKEPVQSETKLKMTGDVYVETKGGKLIPMRNESVWLMPHSDKVIKSYDQLKKIWLMHETQIGVWENDFKEIEKAERMVMLPLKNAADINRNTKWRKIYDERAAKGIETKIKIAVFRQDYAKQIGVLGNTSTESPEIVRETKKAITDRDGKFTIGSLTKGRYIAMSFGEYMGETLIWLVEFELASDKRLVLNQDNAIYLSPFPD